MYSEKISDKKYIVLGISQELKRKLYHRNIGDRMKNSTTIWVQQNIASLKSCSRLKQICTKSCQTLPFLRF